MTRRDLCAGAMGLVTAALAGCGDSTESDELGSAADRALLEATVHTAALGLAALAVTGTTLDLAILRTYVHSTTFLADQSGYFFAYDRTTDVCLAHWKNRDWEDTDKSDYQDSRGTYVIQELSDIAKTAEAKGFMVYYWNNPVTNREERKLGYIELITGTDAYIGSGIYIP